MSTNSNKKTNVLIYVQKWTNNEYVTHQQTTTTELQAPASDRNIYTECGEVKHARVFPPKPGTELLQYYITTNYTIQLKKAYLTLNNRWMQIEIHLSNKNIMDWTLPLPNKKSH